MSTRQHRILVRTAASASYAFGDHVKPFVEGKNLPDAHERSNPRHADASGGYAAWRRTVMAGVSLEL